MLKKIKIENATHTQIFIKAENKEKRKEKTEPKLNALLYFSSSSFSILHLPVVEIDDIVLCILARSMIASASSFT
jgi:hypothetical protein